MVTVNVAYTAPVNPPGASPVLTSHQVWTGLEMKVRDPTDFVKPIRDCKVTEETRLSATTTRTVRDVTFTSGVSDVEIVHSHRPTWIEFVQQKTGSRIGNLLSEGGGTEEGDDSNLLLTFDFGWERPDLDNSGGVDVVQGEEGKKKVEAAREEYRKLSRMAVQETIGVIRQKVQQGIIQ